MAQDILITPGSGEPQILFRGSGTNDTAVEINVMSSYQSATGSGTALLFEGQEGLLFGVTDNLSSGTIFSVADITGLPTIEVDASGDVKLAEFGRDIIAYKPITLESGVPSVTTDKLYSDGYDLYFNGSSVGGGGGTTYTAGSGITIDDADRINVHGGSGHFQNIQIETTGTEDALLFTSTDAGSDAAPVISTMRDSASPADGDYLGQLKFKGRSDTGVERVYAKITGKTLDVTNGTEDGVIEIAVRANGSNEIVSRIRNDGVRVLNDNNLCVQDGGNIGIRTISPNYPLDVEGGAHVASGLLVGDTLDVSGVSTFDQVGTFQSGVKTKINSSPDSATVVFDMDRANSHMVTLGGNRALTVTNVDVGQKFLIRLQQDSTGSRTVTWWSNIQWAEGGTEPTLTTTAGKADLFGFLSPSGGYYDGFVVGQNI